MLETEDPPATLDRMTSCFWHAGLHDCQPIRDPSMDDDVTPASPPAVGYMALVADTPVGTRGFKSPPVDGRVETAYFTFHEFEGRGLATAMAAEFVAVAKRHSSSLVVAAQTLPARDASLGILEKLGSRHIAAIDHPEDGLVREWQLHPEPDT